MSCMKWYSAPGRSLGMGNAMSGLRNHGEMQSTSLSPRRARSGRLVMALGAGPIVLGVLAIAVPTELAAASAPSAITSRPERARRGEREVDRISP